MQIPCTLDDYGGNLLMYSCILTGEKFLGTWVACIRNFVNVVVFRIIRSIYLGVVDFGISLIYFLRYFISLFVTIIHFAPTTICQRILYCPKSILDARSNNKSFNLPSTVYAPHLLILSTFTPTLQVRDYNIQFLKNKSGLKNLVTCVKFCS